MGGMILMALAAGIWNGFSGESDEAGLSSPGLGAEWCYHARTKENWGHFRRGAA